jgi:hypothetical protein
MAGSEMIRYTVLWKQEAEDELAKIWCDHSDRQSVSNAADEFDNDLKNDAHKKGFLFSQHVRSVTKSPLNIYFEIDEADRKVAVIGVQLIDAN